MVPVRQATAILAGMFPDSAPVIVAEHNPNAASNGEKAWSWHGQRAAFTRRTYLNC